MAGLTETEPKMGYISNSYNFLKLFEKTYTGTQLSIVDWADLKTKTF